MVKSSLQPQRCGILGKVGECSFIRYVHVIWPCKPGHDRLALHAAKWDHQSSSVSELGLASDGAQK